jgi:16S rRNA processing protein RimM
MIEAHRLLPVAEALKLFGNNGTIIVKLLPNALTTFRETEPVFAIMEGIPVPFFVASFQPRGNNRADILFDAVYREAQALELVGKTLYQSAPERTAKKGQKQNFEDPTLLVGFTVSDVQMGPLGRVDAFINWDKNPCLSIQHANSSKTFLAPFHEAFILGIDIKAMHISMSLPEGLVEVNS